MRSTRSALRSSAVMAMRSPEDIATAGRYHMPAMRRAILLLLLMIAGSARAKDDAYEIFLPANYDAKNPWTIAYALDARADEESPLQSHRPAAGEPRSILARPYTS